ncbi:MAG: DNA polymerase I [Angelakisella sp.]
MKLLIFDSNSIINRAFYGIKLLSTKDGQFTNAVYGFFNITLKLIDDLAPDQVVFAFDLRAPTFRHKLYDGYKAQRKGMPEELAQQLPVVKELIAALGYPIVEREGYEADDVLGTFAKLAGEDGCQVLLATGDRDSLQLVNEQVTVILAATRVGGAQYLEMTPQAVRDQYGVEPCQLVETKALMGDSSDNIPGVKGIGEKTAFALIQKYGTVAKLYEQLDSIEASPSVKAKLAQGREQADLSRTLGEIFCQVPIGDYKTACQRTEMDNDQLYRLLSRLELHSLMTRLGVTAPATGHSADPRLPEQEPLPGWTATLWDGASPLPTQGQVWLAATLEGDTILDLAIAQEDNTVLFCPAIPPEQLAELMAAPVEKRIDHSKPFYRGALSCGKLAQGVRFDCRLAGYLLSPNSTEYTVERLAAEYGTTLPLPVWQGTGDCPQPVRMAAALPELCRTLTAQIEQNGQQTLLYEIEQPLAEVLASMELTGFRLDIIGLRSFGSEITQLAAGLEQEIYALAGHEFNINSPKQLGEVLFEELALPTQRKNKSGYSTDAEVLESLIPYHEIISKILEYRKYTKLKSTYVEGLQRAAGEDNIIRTSLNQTETRTGRISSTEPNLQNIPIRTEPGSRMRSLFVAGEGNLLVDADYSQIELRVLASIAKDENMIEAFLAGEDIHTNTAAQVFDLPPLFVTPLMRSRAKAVNFGIVYGISAFSLSKDIGVTVAEADKYIKNYLKTYKGVKAYMDATVEQAKEKGYVSTLFGRRRYLPELKSSNHNLRAFGQRVAMNMPIQGTAADIIKVAMVQVYRRLRDEGLTAQLILQVHDELIVEAPEQEVARVTALVRDAMEGAIQLAVPMLVEIGSGKNWGEAH